MLINTFLKKIKILYKKSLIHHHKRIKWLNVIMLFLSGAMFFNGGLGSITLPNFARFSAWDIWVWTMILIILGLLQLYTLYNTSCTTDVNNNYRWGNTILILSGYVLLVVGILFGFKYPPYNWEMTVYPFVGFLLSLVGRQLNKSSYSKTDGVSHGSNNKLHIQ